MEVKAKMHPQNLYSGSLPFFSVVCMLFAKHRAEFWRTKSFWRTESKVKSLCPIFETSAQARAGHYRVEIMIAMKKTIM